MSLSLLKSLNSVIYCYFHCLLISDPAQQSETESPGPELTGMEMPPDIPHLPVGIQGPAKVWQCKRSFLSPAPSPLEEICQEKMPLGLVLF